MHVTWEQVFAWRLRRQFVTSPNDVATTEIVERLCGVQAQVTAAADLAVALRRSKPDPGALLPELVVGTLMKTWAMRGTLHVLTPGMAAAILSLIGSARTWEKPAWQRTFGASPAEVAALTDAVAQVLDGAVLSRDELVDALLANPAFHRLGAELRSGWGALLKPLAWQGALCHGPAQGNRVTFTSPAHLIDGWRGLLEPDAAAPIAITGYLGAYGPATPESFDAWLSRNSLAKTTVRRWFSELGDALTEVDIAGRRAYILTEHADELTATEPTRTSVHLLGAFDQYVLGPGTGDTELLPAEHRSRVSRAAGWISPILVVDGRIAGTWETNANDLSVTTFDGSLPPTRELKAAADHVAAAVGHTGFTVRVA
ncbi:winged helix DNA-binding domain-containing protein [Nocardia sp. NPDC051990]|uniref:winged helix DNA-binding domain-containing protein n=1 Tax=Nocardia sp. NPDC051990 TaxID=3155285 RepID=UPI003426BD7A